VSSSEKTGFDSELWTHLQEIGCPQWRRRWDVGLQLVSTGTRAEQCARPWPPLRSGGDDSHPNADRSVNGPVNCASVLDGDVIATVSFGSVVRGVPSLVPAGAIATWSWSGWDDLIAVCQSPSVRVENLGRFPRLPEMTPAPGPFGHRRGGVVLAACFDDWKVLSAAQLVGSVRLPQPRVDYVKSRRCSAPDRYISTIAHCLADDALLSTVALLTHKAAWALDERRSGGTPWPRWPGCSLRRRRSKLRVTAPLPRCYGFTTNTTSSCTSAGQGVLTLWATENRISDTSGFLFTPKVDA